MASPQRPEFHGISGGGASRSQGQRPGHPPAGQRVKFLVTLLIAVILAGTFFYWIAFGWEGTGGYWWHAQSEPAQSTTAHPMTGSGLAILNSADRKPFMGRPFQLSNVAIQRKVSNSMFWIGPNSQLPMLVVLNGNQNSAQFQSLKTGSKIDVTGTVTKAPPTPDAASQWRLNDPDLGQLEKEGVYIQATEIIGRRDRS